MTEPTDLQPDESDEDLAAFISRFDRIQEEEWGEDHRMPEDVAASFG